MLYQSKRYCQRRYCQEKNAISRGVYVIKKLVSCRQIMQPWGDNMRNDLSLVDVVIAQGSMRVRSLSSFCQGGLIFVFVVRRKTPQTNKQTNKHPNKQINKQTNHKTNKQTNKQTKQTKNVHKCTKIVGFRKFRPN